MQKNSYFPSPLRKDYTIKPVRNFNPIIVKQSSKPSTDRNSQPIIQTKIKYQDGLLVKLFNNQNMQTGLFFIKNYGCVMYNLLDNKPQGQIYVLYLSGVIIQANYQKGFLNGWIISILQGKFILCNFYSRGIKDRYQYFYDVQEKLMILSQYKKGKLIQIKNGEHGQFHQVIKNNDLSNRVKLLQQKKFKLNDRFPKSKFQGFDYFGQLNQKNNTPHGYGVILSQSQIFMGNFNSGCLNGIGGIKFQNGDFYYGQFNNGTCQGYGAINKGNKILYKFNTQTIQKSQFDKFLELQFNHNNKQKWCNKFKQLQVFHEQYKNSYSNQQQQQQSQPQKQQQYQQSQFKLQIQQDNQSFNSQNSNDRSIDIRNNTNKNINININSNTDNINKSKLNKSNIPKLSLFQQMKINENKKQQNRNLTKRQNDKDADQQQQIRILSQRKQSPKKSPKIQIKQANNNNNNLLSKTKANKNKQKQKNDELSKQKPISSTQNNQMIKLKKSTKNNNNNNNQQQYIQIQQQVEDLTNDKWYVASQYNTIKPNQLYTKQKIYKSTQMKLQKNIRNTQIDMGKIMKVSSQVSESREDNFLSMV